MMVVRRSGSGDRLAFDIVRLCIREPVEFLREPVEPVERGDAGGESCSRGMKLVMIAAEAFYMGYFPGTRVS